MDTVQILQAINAVSKQVNDLGRRLDDCFNALHETNAGNIDYLAMMSDIDIPSEDGTIEVTEEE